MIEILDGLVERDLLSPYPSDIVFWGLYSLIPAVMMVSWTHGRPGKDKATRLEKVGVPTNMIESGNLPAGQEALSKAEGFAQTPEDITLVKQGAGLLEFRLGRLNEAIRQTHAMG